MLEDSKPFLAWDARDHNGQPAPGNMAQFFCRTEIDNAKTAAEGRPVHNEKHFIEIWAPAMYTQRGSFPVIPGKNGHGGNKYYQTYWKEYEAWVSEGGIPDNGTPLRELSFLNKAAVADLAHMKIHTVEQLAGVNDAAMGTLPSVFLTYRDKAKAYLAQAAGLAPITKMQAEIDELRAKLAASEINAKSVAAAASQPKREKLTLGKGEAA